MVILTKKIARMGEKHIIIIPKIFIQSKILERKKLYQIHFEEVKEIGEQTS